MAKNILICDDAAFMRMMIKDILTKNGYNVAGEAENGQKAVEKYAELKPDLVVTAAFGQLLSDSGDVAAQAVGVCLDAVRRGQHAACVGDVVAPLVACRGTCHAA